MELGIGGLGQASEIGAGASAVVYKALQIDLDREVAVKVLSATDEAFVRRFRREAMTLGKLSLNPGIVTVHGTGVTESGHPYLILELCESSVLDHLKTSGPFSPEAACLAGVQVADAVSDAHRNGVIHRDIKPGNILLSQTGNYLITDFGISTVTGATLGQTDSIGFTAGYVSPETLRGEEAGTPADVYALGATLFHMVSGQAPFVDQDRASNLLALAQRVINDPVPDLRPLGVPGDICRIIEGAMAKHPTDRPTAAQLRDQLQAVLHSDLTTSPAIVPVQPVAPQTPTFQPDEYPIVSPADAPDVYADSGSTVIGGPSDDFVPSRPVLASTGQQPPSPNYQAPQPAPLPMPQVTRRPWVPVLLGGVAAVVMAVGVFALLISLRSSGGNDVDASGATPDAPSTSTSNDGNAGGDGNSNTGGQGGSGNVGTLSPGETTSTTEGPAALVPLPNVSGMTVAAATARLKQFGLDVKVVEREDDDATPGLVIDQLPASGDDVPVRSIVTLFVATDKNLETVKVPVVVGLAEVEATEAILAAELKQDSTAAFDAAVAEGNVVSVAPPAGTEVEIGSLVSLVISKGPLPTECGQVVGLTEAAAKAALADDGIPATVTRVESATVPTGEVIECTITTAAVLTVSDGPDICTTVVGTTLTAGTAALEAKDLTVTPTPVPNGAVPAKQILACQVEGATALIDYAVALPATCPAAVNGATGAEARAALVAAGFRSTDISAEPTPSNDVPRGSVVSCTVNGAEVKLAVSSGPAAAVTGDLTVSFKAITVTEACAGDGLRPEIYGSIGFAYDGDPKAIWTNRPSAEARIPNSAGEVSFSIDRTWADVPTGKALALSWDLSDEDIEGRAGDEDGDDDPISTATREVDLTGEDRTWRPVSGPAGPCAVQFTVEISWTNLSS